MDDKLDINALRTMSAIGHQPLDEEHPSYDVVVAIVVLFLFLTGISIVWFYSCDDYTTRSRWWGADEGTSHPAECVLVEPIPATREGYRVIPTANIYRASGVGSAPPLASLPLATELYSEEV